MGNEKTKNLGGIAVLLFAVIGIIALISAQAATEPVVVESRYVIRECVDEFAGQDDASEGTYVEFGGCDDGGGTDGSSSTGGSTDGTTSGGSSSGGDPGDYQAFFSRPSGWESYQTRNVGSGGSINLSDNTDYRLVFDQTPNRRVHVQGGRNVVIIGGEVNINTAHGSINNDNNRMGMRFSDQTGIVHVEGVWLHGEYINEGIQFDAPDADAQLYNIRIDNLKGAQQRPPYSHADIVQPWGGLNSLKIDYLTGSSRYQGFLFKADFSGPLGPIDVRHVDIEMIEGPSADNNFPNNGGRYGIATASGSDAYTSISWDPGTVWLDHNSQYKSNWYNNMIEFGSNDEPQSDDTGSDSLGNYVDMNSWKSKQTGRVYSGNPPGGEYVPVGVAGMNYSVN